jgi:glycosyltransferase involved in cell wall biosynthesis
MNIVHINFSDTYGGASIAAFRHHQAINKSQFAKSTMLVIDKQTQDKDVFCFAKGLRKFIQKIFFLKLGNIITKICSPKIYFSFLFAGFDLSQNKIIQNADIIIIHWINPMTTSIYQVKKILKLNKPTYLFLHDMWYLTGGCHYSLECNMYQSNCGQCNKIKVPYLAKLQFKEKENWNKYSNLNILTPSTWLYNCTQKSKLFHDTPKYICRNLIDTQIFIPKNKNLCKKTLGLSLNKKTIAFIATSIKNPVKGLNILLKSLSQLSEQEYECLIIGSYNSKIKENIPLKTIFTGYIKDESKLVNIYNAADFLIIPSIAENFPNVILEAMACGIPVIGFNIGGIPDLIQHKINGYISMNPNSEGLIEGIQWCSKKDYYDNLSINARESIVTKYSYENITNIYNFININKQNA